MNSNKTSVEDTNKRRMEEDNEIIKKKLATVSNVIIKKQINSDAIIWELTTNHNISQKNFEKFETIISEMKIENEKLRERWNSMQFTKEKRLHMNKCLQEMNTFMKDNEPQIKNELEKINSKFQNNVTTFKSYVQEEEKLKSMERDIEIKYTIEENKLLDQINQATPYIKIVAGSNSDMCFMDGVNERIMKEIDVLEINNSSAQNREHELNEKITVSEKRASDTKKEGDIARKELTSSIDEWNTKYSLQEDDIYKVKKQITDKKDELALVKINTQDYKERDTILCMQLKKEDESHEKDMSNINDHRQLNETYEILKMQIETQKTNECDTIEQCAKVINELQVKFNKIQLENHDDTGKKINLENESKALNINMDEIIESTIQLECSIDKSDKELKDQLINLKKEYENIQQSHLKHNKTMEENLLVIKGKIASLDNQIYIYMNEQKDLESEYTELCKEVKSFKDSQLQYNALLNQKAELQNKLRDLRLKPKMVKTLPKKKVK